MEIYCFCLQISLTDYSSVLKLSGARESFLLQMFHSSLAWVSGFSVSLMLLPVFSFAFFLSSSSVWAPASFSFYSFLFFTIEVGGVCGLDLVTVTCSSPTLSRMICSRLWMHHPNTAIQTNTNTPANTIPTTKPTCVSFSSWLSGSYEAGSVLSISRPL